MRLSSKNPKTRETVPYLRLELRTGASVEVREFSPGPVRFSYHPPWEVDLGAYCSDRKVGTPSAPPLFILSSESGALSVSSRVTLLICGVERKAGPLPLEGTLRYKNLRIRFLGFVEREAAPPASAPKPALLPVPKKQRRMPVLPVPTVPLRRLLQGVAAAAILAAAALLLYRHGSGPGGRPAPELSAAAPPAAAQAMPERHEQAVPGPPTPQASPAQVQLPPETARPARVRMVAPGTALPEAAVDYLFIHAHPDDESLDFGALIAHVDRAGLSAAVLLLTDGEGGIFSSDYAGPRENLRDLRVREAAEALSILGASWYIRMGYRNHPYNGTGDRRRPDDILNGWGGDDAVAAVAEAIAALKPRVVAAPDGPSAAREHFEHEAAGLLVRRALDRLRITGGHEVEALLLCVDPRQTSVYSDLVPVPQRAARAAHATQADASHFGILMADAYPDEWYLPAAGPGREELSALIGK